MRRRDLPVYALIWLAGKALALLPAGCARLLCQGLGALTYRYSSRRHTILSGLARAFPEKSSEWRERIARTNCARMFEMFLLALALPRWSERAIRQRFRLGDSLQRILDEHGAKRPILLAIPHSALMEALTLIPLLARDCPPIVTLYRPLDVPAAEVYVRRARERWGAELVARREGLLTAKNQLASGHGIVGLLFDQSAGELGHLTLFFDRVCSSTNLPGLLATKAGALPVFLQTRREGFWRGTIEASLLPGAATTAETVIRINQALEEHLRGSDEACASWFWAHQRWKGPQRRREVLGFPRRKSYLKEQLRLQGRSHLPKKTHIAVRLDPRPELLATGRRLVRVIRSQRPDAVFWLLVPEGLEIGKFGAIERVHALPAEAEARQRELSRINQAFVDIYFCLDPSPAAIREARLIQSEFSAGVVPPGAARRAYHLPLEVNPRHYFDKPWQAWRARLPELGLPLDILDEQVKLQPVQKPGSPVPSGSEASSVDNASDSP